jgi:hypothetical protein
VNDAAAVMQPELGDANSEYLSVYGTLFLAGAMDAARADDRATTQTFIREADEAAQRLGADANHMWTAFGPTNVAVHCVATAGELGDIQIAADLGSRAVLLEAEQAAPEQVRHHYLSRELVIGWIRGTRGRPSYPVADLARRLGVIAGS